MHGWRGFLAGGLALIALYTVVSAASDQASGASRIAGLIGPQGFVASWAHKLLDPTVPAIGAAAAKRKAAAPAPTPASPPAGQLDRSWA